MRRKKTWVIGIASGILCVACVLLYTQSVRGQAEAARAEALARFGGEQLEVCVAARDIAAGETVQVSAVEVKLWVADLLPADAVRSSTEIVGKQATSSILAGEVFSLKRFEGTTTAIDVPDDLVAVSVAARDVQAVGGAVSPGMEVDVYATGDTATELLARSVLVISTSASVSDSRSDAAVSWVTLAVEPSAVQELIAAAQSTDLYFVLPGEAAPSAAPDKQPENDSAAEASATANAAKGGDR